MKNMILGTIVATVLSGCATCGKNSDPLIGNWSARLPYDDMYAGSLIFSRGEDGTPKAYVLWRWASPEPMNDVKIDDKRIFTAEDVKDGVSVLRSGKKNYFVLKFV